MLSITSYIEEILSLAPTMNPGGGTIAGKNPSEPAGKPPGLEEKKISKSFPDPLGMPRKNIRGSNIMTN